MKPSVTPILVLLIISAVFLTLSVWIFGAYGPVVFLVTAAVFGCATGWPVGRKWRLYPWQIGAVAAIPSVLFVVWRFFTSRTPAETSTDISTFIFFPLMVLIGAHFGGLIGRWQALRAKVPGKNRA